MLNPKKLAQISDETVSITISHNMKLYKIITRKFSIYNHYKSKHIAIKLLGCILSLIKYKWAFNLFSYSNLLKINFIFIIDLYIYLLHYEFYSNILELNFKLLSFKKKLF